MSSHSRNLVRELERKNREIMRDIHHLKRAHRNQRIMQMPPGEDPSIVTELEVCKIEWGLNYGYYVKLSKDEFQEEFLFIHFLSIFTR